MEEDYREKITHMSTPTIMDDYFNFQNKDNNLYILIEYLIECRLAHLTLKERIQFFETYFFPLNTYSNRDTDFLSFYFDTIYDVEKVCEQALKEGANHFVDLFLTGDKLEEWGPDIYVVLEKGTINLLGYLYFTKNEKLVNLVYMMDIQKIIYEEHARSRKKLIYYAKSEEDVLYTLQKIIDMDYSNPEVKKFLKDNLDDWKVNKFPISYIKPVKKDF